LNTGIETSMPEFSTIQNVWGFACNPCTPSSCTLKLIY